MPLVEARKIYAQTSGESRLDQQIRVLLTQRLRATNRFTVTDTKNANAALMISVWEMGPNGTTRRVRMTLQLIDTGARVIWPLAGTHRDYSGLPEAITTKAIDDLMADINRLDSSRK